MHKFIIWFSVVLFASLSVFPYIVKIGNDEISKENFQDFVDVQKYIENQDTFDELAKKKKTTKNNILTDYIDQLIVVSQAKKKGYDKKSEIVKKAFEEQKKTWITTMYIAKNIDIQSLSVNESDLRSTYNELPETSKTKPYNQLSDQDKQGLIQFATIKSAQEKKKVFRKKLEKKYKVVRYGLKKKVVAKVEGENITAKDFQDKIDEQLNLLGITEKQIVDRDPKRLGQVRQGILDEIIFEKLVALDIQKTGFAKQKIVMKSYGFLLDRVISEQFILKEIASKVSVSSQELDEAFVQVSKQNPSIKNMLPTEQEQLLKKYILQAKLPEIIKEYLVEVKEGILIKRNKNNLSKIS